MKKYVNKFPTRVNVCIIGGHLFNIGSKFPLEVLVPMNLFPLFNSYEFSKTLCMQLGNFKFLGLLIT